MHFELEDGWHMYVEDPGDAGLPTTICWTGASDMTFGPLQWPPAQRFVDPGDIKTFGYAEAVVLFSRLSVSTQAAPDASLPIQARATWLACKEICIPGSAERIGSSGPLFRSEKTQLCQIRGGGAPRGPLLGRLGFVV